MVAVTTLVNVIVLLGWIFCIAALFIAYLIVGCCVRVAFRNCVQDTFTAAEVILLHFAALTDPVPLPPLGWVDRVRHLLVGVRNAVSDGGGIDSLLAMALQLLKDYPRHCIVCAWEALLPGLPFRPFRWMPRCLTWLAFRDSSSPNPLDGAPGFEKETWIYVNGICSNGWIAELNGKRLQELFCKRPITVIHNPTDSVWVDVLETFVGKLKLFSWWQVEPEKTLRKAVEEALLKSGDALLKSGDALLDTGKIRVVLIAHSQGTIIANNVVHQIADSVANAKANDEKMKKMKKGLSKLEVYLFADCAHHVDVDLLKSLNVHMESICNERDPALYPVKGQWSDVNGKVVNDRPKHPIVQPDKRGHFLNTHYLDNFRREYRDSRLHNYETLPTRNWD
ncbi:unnamed protein product [Vitrella brassicaformis CCMP3155]|uniref:DUF676 domain-containing protein n=1 Tax=Vitrella brassicaformis (strain CCMP3155) TaxID=1169540 RepID=A0A0G4EAN0_VITBC|nr:unnamed protein product [Vitrella brassicaformis CCMP3155]|eukprot:CEL92698.1 unnamed protein product [Vitrella brassicaformis CCMP3155]